MILWISVSQFESFTDQITLFQVGIPGNTESQDGVSGEVQNTSLSLPISSEVLLEDAWLPLAHAFIEPRRNEE